MSPARRVAAYIGQQGNSPGRMTAASVLARAFAIAAPLPFLYAAFPVQAVAFWLVVITFQSLVGAFSGIIPTVAMQMIAYARMGSSAVGGNVEDHQLRRVNGPNWPLIAEVNRSSLRLFGAIAAAWIAFAGLAGTLIVWRPMMASEVISEAAGAWAVFIAGAAVRLLAQPFVAFSLGFGAVAEVRRLEALSWSAGGVVAIVCLTFLPNLALAMLALQAPILLNYVQYRRLARRKGWKANPSGGTSSSVPAELWSRGWRGGIGTLAGMLTVYGSGFILAQVGGGRLTASYLLGLNVLGIVGQISSSPVFAAMPAMASRFAEGLKEEMRDLAQRAIARSMRVFALLVVIAPIAVACVNPFLQSPVAFPAPGLWLAMCVAAMLVRHGGDHLQYYTTTNDIRWHLINPAFLVLSLGPFLVLPASNVMLLPLVQGLAAAGFYLPYSRWLTKKYLDYELRQELTDFLLPMGAMLAGLIAFLLVAQATS